MDAYVLMSDLLTLFWKTFENLILNTIEEDFPTAVTFIEELPLNLVFLKHALMSSACFLPCLLFFYICYYCCRPSTKNRAVSSESILPLVKSFQVDLQSARNDFEGLHPALYWVHFKCHMALEKALIAFLLCKFSESCQMERYSLLQLATRTKDKFLMSKIKWLHPITSSSKKVLLCFNYRSSRNISLDDTLLIYQETKAICNYIARSICT